MTDQNKKKEVDKTDGVCYEDVFNKLMTIGSTVKEATEELLQLAAQDKKSEGGDGSATENT